MLNYLSPVGHRTSKTGALSVFFSQEQAATYHADFAYENRRDSLSVNSSGGAGVIVQGTSSLEG